MDDIALKPKLLRLLLREYIPDDKHPFRNPSELLYVVHTIKTHKLLSEWAPKSTDEKLAEEWKSTVDRWVNRLLTLASSNMPDKCWAGISLLGLTCQECSSERFLASYSGWFSKLLLLIQQPTESYFVKAASCASASDLLTRLSGFPNTKKDGTSQATKLIQPILKLLDEDSSTVFWQESLFLLCTVMNCFPYSVHRHHESIEGAIALKIMSGKCSASVLKILGNALCLLPKSKGDENSWSSMMHKILVLINDQLNDAFHGLEEESRSIETTKILLPPGKECPKPLGGLELSQETSDVAVRRPEKLFVSRVSTLMDCVCTMLTDAYPVQVPVPVRAVMSLAGRVLMVDGSLSLALYASTTIMKQELICSELASLQLHSLEMLSAIIKGLRSQLSPHVADIIQLLAKYLQRCRLPRLRQKAYSILKALLLSMGVGVVSHLSQVVVTNAFIDLESFVDERKGTSFGGYVNAPVQTLPQSRHRKRKQASMTEVVHEQPHRGDSEVAMPPAELSVKLAALEALESLLAVGGSLRSEGWRTNVDHLLITVATNACKAGWSKEEKSIFLCDEPTPLWADFQLASLRALLASLLSPGRVHPPYLSLALELFRQGMQETGSRFAEYCRHALLTLEVLIHPRALPLVDFSPSTDRCQAMSGNVPATVTYQTRTLGKDTIEPESDNDELYNNWVESDDEMEDVPVTQRNPDNPNNTTGPPSSPLTVELPDKSEAGVSASGGASERVAVDRDDDMVELDPADAKMAQVSNDAAMKKDTIITGIHEEENKDSGFAAMERLSSTPISKDKSKELSGKSDDELSMDSLPDIVDADPDSD